MTKYQIVDFLNKMASRLDAWADESIRGGWSTHQVEANRQAANDCRRAASQVLATKEIR